MKKASFPLSLPEDLVVEILLKLPVRSLLRFKCVCKSWLSLISDPHFAKSHYDVAAAPAHRVLYHKLSADSSKFNSIDIEASLHDDSAEVVFNLPLPPSASKYGCWPDVVGSCRGFILFNGFLSSDFITFVIWNPSTGLHKRILHKRIKVRLHARLFGFGYDSSTDDYVIVIVMLPLPQSEGRCMKVQCFSVRTNSWSCIERTVPYHLRSSLFHGLLLNGALHWLVNSNDNLPIIMAFHVLERRLSEIPLPHDVAIGLGSELCLLKVMGGCLCICFDLYRPPMSEMWIMKKYKVQSSWTKLFILSADYYNLFSNFSPICFTKKDEILGSDVNETLVRLNDKGKLLEHQTNWNMDRFFGLQHCAMYRESLLSLPGEFVEATEDEDAQGQQ